MQLPAKLLHRVRVGVGVGAVMLGGCDLVEDASAQVLGEPVAVEIAQAPAPVPAAAKPAPEPMLLGREGSGGLSGLVGESIARVENDPRSAEVPEVAIHGGPEEPAVVPFADPLAGLDPEPRSSIRPRPRPEPSAIAIDEPCDPAPRPKVRTKVRTTKSESEMSEWHCPACGRG